METEQKATAPELNEKSWENVIAKFNNDNGNLVGSISQSAFYDAFSRAYGTVINQPEIQNKRVKGISSLPVNFTKEEIGTFLRSPYGHEMALRQTSEILRWTAYPYFKITKTYQDIPTYRNYIKPLYLTKDAPKTDDFKREAYLLDKFCKTLNPSMYAHKITGQAVSQGKVFYTPRYSVDKTHNQINYAMLQQLPEDWCYIIGYNNVSGYTVSFNMMYFMEPGTDPKAFGDLFDPYLDDFNNMFEEGQRGSRKKFAYAEKQNVIRIGKNKSYYFDASRVNVAGEGNPYVFKQDGRWMYYVTLPIDRVWTFEIDDTNPAVISPLSGLMLTYAQQSSFEQVQLSLLLNPLSLFLTGEIETFDNDVSMKADQYKVSNDARVMFETLFYNMLSSNNTSGVGLFTAPLKNFKSHTFPESANANDISETFNRYGMEKAGLAGLIPVTDDVKASQVAASEKIESRFSASTIYPQFCRMMNWIIGSLNLKYQWSFEMFGTIFTEEEIRKNAQTAISNGDISAHFILSALDGNSWIDKLSMMYSIKESGMLDMLIPPITSYTAKQDVSGLPPQGGRPKEDGEFSEAKEKAIDAGVTEE